MAAGHQKIVRIFLQHPHKKETHGPLIKDSINTAKEVAKPTMATVMAKAYTQPNLRTSCIMVAKPTTAPKTTPFSTNQRKKLEKDYAKPSQQSFTFSNTSLSKQPSPTSGILSILPLRHIQSSTTFTNSIDNIPSPTSIDNIPSSSPTNHLPSAKQHQPSSQNQSQPTTSTSTTSPSVPATK
jgi:hypothetical protein